MQAIESNIGRSFVLSYLAAVELTGDIEGGKSGQTHENGDIWDAVTDFDSLWHVVLLYFNNQNWA